MTEYISREAAIDAVLSYKGYFQDQLSTNNMILKMEAEVAIDDVSAADVKPVLHGRWLYDGQCSECGEYDAVDPFGSKYCPHCGARMDGGADND